ncbi:Phytanoyl-CoA dioxygenase [Trypanosoma melophagium]|uniref:Phytanoyl-CoA dioxygenase n=1 Tax=Trypanosoma melophagium TaxID=715481 RepID=UPI003519DE6D|nr:Phytanoyl-CoA dioxygenase [Trypanosoma melophagium]
MYSSRLVDSCLRRLSSPSIARRSGTSPLFFSCRWKSYVLKFLRGQLPEDLKDLNGALGCLYGTLPDVDEFGQFVIAPEVVERFHQLGYVKLPHPVLDAQQIDKLADEVNELANNVEHHPKTEKLYATSLADLTGGPLFYCQGQWRAAWGMHDLIYLPTITVAASQVLGNSLVRLWYDEVFMKEARRGPSVPWQQNYARWQHTKPVNHVTVMIALDAMNKDRGAPCLVPGSHRWRNGDLLPAVPYDPSKDEAQQLNTIWEIINEEESEVLMDTPPVTVDMKRGEALLIHPLALFATHGNRSLDAVRCCFIHYMGEKTYATQNGPLLPHTTKFQAGALIQGPFYPVVFDPAMAEELSMLPASPAATLESPGEARADP